MRISATDLTIRELIGQLMMPMLPDTADLRADPALFARVLDEQARYGFGGYIVFRGDREHTPRYMARLNDSAELPLLYGSDLERGAGQQFAGATDFPDAMALGATNRPDLAYQQGAITAVEARRLGVHWVFTPLADLAGEPDNPIIANRALGDEPRAVGRMVAAYVEGLQREGAIATLKHFPGHGPTAVDSHAALPVLDVSRLRLEQGDFVPFRQGLAAGAKSVMIGHLAVPALDETGAPATFSRRIVQDLLRDQWGFNGLVVTDALMMGALTALTDPGTAAVRALMAGCDVLLMPPDPGAVVEAVLRAVEEGALTKHRLMESAERVLAAKWELGLFDPPDEDDPELDAAYWPDYGPAVEAIAEACPTLVGDPEGRLPLTVPGDVAVLALDDDEADSPFLQTWKRLAEARGAAVAALGPEPSADAVAAAFQAVATAAIVVVPVSMAIKAWKERTGLSPALAELPRQLARRGQRVVLISHTTPYLLARYPEAAAWAAAYSPLPPVVEAVWAALWGEAAWKGSLPVAPGLVIPRRGEKSPS